jgi:hypothetical protein
LIPVGPIAVTLGSVHAVRQRILAIELAAPKRFEPPRCAVRAVGDLWSRPRGGVGPAPNARAKFGAGLRSHRYVRPRVCAPGVQAVPRPTLPTTAVCDARIRWRKLVHVRLDPIAWTGLPLGQYDALIAIDARIGAEVVTYEIRIAPDKARQ